MATIKALSDISEKWSSVTPGRSAYFEDGVRNPRKDWAQAAAASESAYSDGVSAAVARKGYSTGVRKAGTDKWSEKTLSKGVERWPSGVRAAGTDYEDGFSPFHRVIESTTLPPRRATGDPSNIERVTAIATALHQAKVKAG
jgi:hypothetical protein